MTHTSLTQNLNAIVTAARNELEEPPKLHQRGWLPSQADLFANDWIVLYTPAMEGTPDVEEV